MACSDLECISVPFTYRANIKVTNSTSFWHQFDTKITQTVVELLWITNRDFVFIKLYVWYKMCLYVNLSFLRVIFSTDKTLLITGLKTYVREISLHAAKRRSSCSVMNEINKAFKWKLGWLIVCFSQKVDHANCLLLQSQINVRTDTSVCSVLAKVHEFLFLARASMIPLVINSNKIHVSISKIMSRFTIHGHIAYSWLSSVEGDCGCTANLLPLYFYIIN